MCISRRKNRSGLDAVLKKKRLDRKKIQAYMDECCILAKKCEIRLPGKKHKDAE